MPLPEVTVNRSSPVPLYFQVAEQLERAIHDGHLRPRRPDRERGVARRPARALPADHAPGDPDARRQGHARPQARRGHPGRAGADPSERRADQPVRRPEAGRDEAGHGRARAADLCRPRTTRPRTSTCRSATAVWELVRLRSVKDEPLALMRNFVPGERGRPGPRGLHRHRALRALPLLRRPPAGRAPDDRGAPRGRGGGQAPAAAARATRCSRWRARRTTTRGGPWSTALHLYRPDLYAFETTLVDR